MRPQILLLALFLAVLPLSAIAAIGPDIAGGIWEPIKDLKNEHIIAIAEFAVTDFNRKSHAGVVLKDIRGGDSAAGDSDYRYLLHLTVEQPPSCYKAVVLEYNWLHHWEVLSFDSETC
ncbi:cysteine proteinase inhibitor 1 [Eucalyptus grandis]|uniref:Uncharacterized protein n=2 Tax=Eucalyptus grandis TaxID=71139 RepID=A0ACC3L4K1_EUCGR|nr:cysteine proteinase inhibitor 1 [Eucalyptus grandis]KAK3433536.1 hypothetical protein EUGRSUZ_D01422 [Eucalyptus grandis]